MSKIYEASGVSLEAGYDSVRRIKKHVEKTKRQGMVDLWGSFGGVFDLSALGLKEPLLISGTDGVGTKLKVAFMLDKHDTIGIDVVAMCVNDILTQGGEPLFFLDYIACGKNDPKTIEAIVAGVAQGCVLAGAALIGGETAEMPGFYKEDEYDIAGFSVGALEKKDLITGEGIKAGQVLIGLGSSGIHSNGFSLVRKIVFEDNQVNLGETYEGMDRPLGEVLLTPTKIYVKSILSLLKTVKVHGMVHITGGGFHENIPRILPEGLGAKICEASFPKLPIYSFLEAVGDLKREDMYHVFNMGIGFMLVVDEKDSETVIEHLEAQGEKAYLIGEVIDKPGVEIL